MDSPVSLESYSTLAFWLDRSLYAMRYLDQSEQMELQLFVPEEV